MSHVLSLSEGSLEVLLNGGCFENPVVQILDHRVAQDNDGYKSFHLLVSDGKHSHNFRMLITPENAKLMEELSKYSVVQIQKFITQLKNEKFVKVILIMEMIMHGKYICKELGNPQIWREKSSETSLDAPRPALFPSSDFMPQSGIPSPLLDTTIPKPMSTNTVYATQTPTSTSQPVASVAQLTAFTFQQATNMSLSTTLTSHSNSTIVQPSTLNSEPTTLVAQPTKPLAQLTIPVAQPTTSEAQPTIPVAQLTIPVAQLTTPVAQPTRPVAQPTTPVDQPTAPMDQPTTPVAQPTTPEAHPTTLVAQPTTPVAQPITGAVQPTTLTAEPITPKSQSTVFSSQPTTPSSKISVKCTTPSSHTTTSLYTTTPSHTTPFDTPDSCRSTTYCSQPTTPYQASISSSNPLATSSKNANSARKALFVQENFDATRPRSSNIADLRFYNNMSRWQIKAWVRNKSAILTSKKQTRWFSMELFDKTGEIRAVVFGDACDKFHCIFQNNKVYLISGGKLIEDSQKYRVDNKVWQIKIDSDTKVQECMEVEDFMPSTKYNFVPIREISTTPVDSYIDVIGVCKSASELEDKIISDKVTKIRRVTLVDNSNSGVNSNQIVLTLWDDEAKKFDATSHPVIALKRARVTQFLGIKELTYSQSRTVLHMNPDIPEALPLRRWYDEVYYDSVKWITFSEAKALRVGAGNDFSILGVVTQLDSENVVYKACPENWCNKKLVVLRNGIFKCEKCNKEFSNYKYSVRLMAVVSDPTGDQSVTAFNSCAEVMLGKNAAEINHLFEHDRKNYIQLFEDLLYKIFVFKICTKIETFENVSRRKYIAIHVQPIDYKETNRCLISSLKSITGKEI